MFAADEHLDADAGRVEAHRVLHVHGDLFVGQLLAQDARPAARPQHHGSLRLGGDQRAQDAPGAEERIALRQQWHDREVNALKPRGRPLEVAMVHRQHDGASRDRIEGLRQPVLHAPIELVRALEEEAGRGLRPVGLVSFAFFVGFGHGVPPS